MRWIDLAETDSPNDDLRGRGHAAGAALFARGEGIHRGRGEYYFTCTSGGAARLGQIMRYLPSRHEGRPGEDAAPARLELFVESADPRVMDYGDNLTVAPWGHLIVCEDRADNKVNHLKGVTPDGQALHAGPPQPRHRAGRRLLLARRATLFVNAYDPGRTLAITGPWRSVRA